MLDRELIRFGYELLMDLKADTGLVDKLQQRYTSTRALREYIMSTPEFRRENPRHSRRGHILNEPPLSIDVDIGMGPMELLAQHIKSEWEKLGQHDAHWSVVSSQKYRSDNLDDDGLSQFYETGRSEFKTIQATLARIGMADRRFDVISEYGCGVGRLTLYLSSIGRQIHAYDISQSHLDLARRVVAQRGIQNVDFHSIEHLSDLSKIAGSDFVYCVIVLQHNPPPLIKIIIEKLLGVLSSGGVAIFQVPTYRSRYSFRIDEYLSTERSGIEMHILPMPVVFAIIKDMSCHVVEVIEDSRAGSVDIISNTFVVKKD